jgi:hypothetical protein
VTQAASSAARQVTSSVAPTVKSAPKAVQASVPTAVPTLPPVPVVPSLAATVAEVTAAPQPTEAVVSEVAQTLDVGVALASTTPALSAATDAEADLAQVLDAIPEETDELASQQPVVPQPVVNAHVGTVERAADAAEPNAESIDTDVAVEPVGPSADKSLSLSTGAAAPEEAIQERVAPFVVTDVVVTLSPADWPVLAPAAVITAVAVDDDAARSDATEALTASQATPSPQALPLSQANPLEPLSSAPTAPTPVTDASAPTTLGWSSSAAVASWLHTTAATAIPQLWGTLSPAGRKLPSVIVLPNLAPPG